MFDRRQFTMAGLGSLVALSGASRLVAVPSEGSVQNLDFVDPDLRSAAQREQQIQAEMGVLDDAVIKRLRQSGAPPMEPTLDDVSAVTRMVPGVPGQPPVKVLVINSRTDSLRPGILHMHGGGYVLGTLRGETRFLQEIARSLDCVIVSVDYRLAPETTYLGSGEDNYAGLLWMYREAASIGVDPKRIAVMGESAGGGHAALLAIKARDRGEVPIRFQALIYPMLDDRTGSTVHHRPPIGSVGWHARNNKFGWRAFLGVEPGTKGVPVAGVPARVESTAGLPPTYIAVGGIDLFVSENMEFARRLVEAGVPTELLVMPGMFHAAERAAPSAPISRRFNAAKLDALGRAFARRA